MVRNNKLFCIFFIFFLVLLFKLPNTLAINRVLPIEPSDPNQNSTVNLPINLKVNSEVDIKLISNITLITNEVEGFGLPLDLSASYLIEGDQIIFDVEIYYPKGIDNINIGSGGNVFVTVNDQIGVNCFDKKKIDNHRATAHCVLTAETVESMYDQGLVEAVIETDSGERDSIKIGSWFFNPNVAMEIDNPLTFPDAQRKERIYSESIILRNNVENREVDVPLSLYISKPGHELNIYYFAENGAYSTANDPRADEEGYIQLKTGEGFNDPEPFYNSREILQVSEAIDENLWNEIYPYNGNWLKRDGETTIKLRFDVPEDFPENYNGNIYVWGSALQGPTVGYRIPFNFKVTIKEPVCLQDSDCGFTGFMGDSFCSQNDVFNSFQSSECINPETIQSYCSVETNPLLVEECELGCENGSCIRDTTPPEAIIEFDVSSNDLVVDGSDDYDEDVEVSAKESCLGSKKSIFYSCKKTYTLTDDYENNLKIYVESSKIGRDLYFYRITNLRYNDKPVKITYNHLYVSKLKNKNIQQDIYQMNKYLISVNYSAKKDHSQIRISENKTVNEITKPGLHLIKLKTDSGKLSYLIN